MNGETFNAKFKKAFRTHLNKEIGTNQYRHAAKAFTEKCIKNVYAQAIVLAAEEQIGHGSETWNMVYARSNLDLRNISREKFQIFYRTSIAWHRLLHLDKVPATSSSSSSSSASIANVHQTSSATSSKELLNRLDQLNVEEKVQQVLEKNVEITVQRELSKLNSQVSSAF